MDSPNLVKESKSDEETSMEDTSGSDDGPGGSETQEGVEAQDLGVDQGTSSKVERGSVCRRVGRCSNEESPDRCGADERAGGTPDNESQS